MFRVLGCRPTFTGTSAAPGEMVDLWDTWKMVAMSCSLEITCHRIRLPIHWQRRILYYVNLNEDTNKDTACVFGIPSIPYSGK